MSDAFDTRRNILKAAALGAIAAAPGFSLFKIAARVRRLRVAVSQGLPFEIFKDIEASYLLPVAQELNASLEILPMPSWTVEKHLRGQAGDQQISGFLTSASTCPRLSPENVYFGPLPYGLPVEKKAQWLDSEPGRGLQDEYFGNLGFKPQLLALGSDDFGVLTRRPLASVEDLQGASIAFSSDVRAKWFLSRGARALPIYPKDQANAMNLSGLDISEPLSPQAIRFISSGLTRPSEWMFLNFPRIRTAPSVYCLWPRASWGAFSGHEQRRIESIRQSGFDLVSKAWQRRETLALNAIADRHRLDQVPQNMVDMFLPDALQHRSTLARHNAFARRLTEAYNRISLG